MCGRLLFIQADPPTYLFIFLFLSSIYYLLCSSRAIYYAAITGGPYGKRKRPAAGAAMAHRTTIFLSGHNSAQCVVYGVEGGKDNIKCIAYCYSSIP